MKKEKMMAKMHKQNQGIYTRILLRRRRNKNGKLNLLNYECERSLDI